jgi:hypothetical protein
MQMRCGSRNCTALNAFFVSCAIQELDAGRLRRVGNVLSIDFPLLLTKTKRKASDCERCCLPGALPEELYPIRLTSSQPLEKSDVEKKIVDCRRPRLRFIFQIISSLSSDPSFLCVSKIFSAPPRLRGEIQRHCPGAHLLII